MVTGQQGERKRGMTFICWVDWVMMSSKRLLFGGQGSEARLYSFWFWGQGKMLLKGWWARK